MTNAAGFIISDQFHRPETPRITSLCGKKSDVLTVAYVQFFFNSKLSSITHC